MRAVHFGEHLKAARESAGLTQVELAERTGYPYSAISAVENERKTVSWETAVRLIEACGGTIEVRQAKRRSSEAAL